MVQELGSGSVTRSTVILRSMMYNIFLKEFLLISCICLIRNISGCGGNANLPIGTRTFKCTLCQSGPLPDIFQGNVLDLPDSPSCLYAATVTSQIDCPDACFTLLAVRTVNGAATYGVLRGCYYLFAQTLLSVERRDYCETGQVHEESLRLDVTLMLHFCDSALCNVANPSTINGVCQNALSRPTRRTCYKCEGDDISDSCTGTCSSNWCSRFAGTVNGEPHEAAFCSPINLFSDAPDQCFQNSWVSQDSLGLKRISGRFCQCNDQDYCNGIVKMQPSWIATSILSLAVTFIVYT